MQVVEKKKEYSTVRIPRGMSLTVEGFLRTKEAANMGMRNKTDVITAATYELLKDYKSFRHTNVQKNSVY